MYNDLTFFKSVSPEYHMPDLYEIFVNLTHILFINSSFSLFIVLLLILMSSLITFKLRTPGVEEDLSAATLLVIVVSAIASHCHSYSSFSSDE